MKEINRGDLKYFAAHALTGLCTNPFYLTVDGQRYLNMKNLTIEKIAVQSSLEILQELHKVEVALDQMEAAELAKESQAPTSITPSSTCP